MISYSCLITKCWTKSQQSQLNCMHVGNCISCSYQAYMRHEAIICICQLKSYFCEHIPSQIILHNHACPNITMDLTESACGTRNNFLAHFAHLLNSPSPTTINLCSYMLLQLHVQQEIAIVYMRQKIIIMHIVRQLSSCITQRVICLKCVLCQSRLYLEHS